MPLKTVINLGVSAELTKALGGLTGVLTPEIRMIATMLSGVGLDQADKLYYSKPIIAGSATLALDLATGGGLVDLYGDALALVKVKLIVVKAELALCPNVINLVQPANGVNFLGADGDLIPIRPGGGVVLWAPDLTGYPVVAATDDLIHLVNTAAGNVQPEILIAGASA